MRFVSFIRSGQAGFGVVVEDEGVADLTGWRGVRSLQALLAAGLLDDAIEEATGRRPDVDLARLQLLPVIPRPSKIICVGINYVAHAEEAGRKVGDYPVIFHRFADTLVAHGQPVVKPKVSEQFDYEASLNTVYPAT